MRVISIDELANPRKIVFILYLLCPDHKHRCFYDLEMGLYSLELYKTFRGVFSCEEIDTFLNELISDQLIEYITVQEISGEDQYHASCKEYLIDNKIGRDDFVIPEKYSPLFMVEDMDHDTSSKVLFNICLSIEHTNSYLDNYLNLWEKNQLHFKTTNILRKEKQISIVVHQILNILKDSPNEKILISLENISTIEPLATLLFLEKNHYVTIDSFEYLVEENSIQNNGTILVRLSVYDKIYQDFILTEDNVSYDFKELSKDIENINKITFSPPYHLHYNDSDYKLKKGKFPYLIINKAFEEKIITAVPIEEILKEMNEEEKDLKKAVENFRKALRDKFKFSENETFLEITEDTIVLKASLFKFQPKKS